MVYLFLIKDSMSISSDKDGSNKLEKISDSQDFDEDEIFFSDPCNNAPKGQDTEEQGLRDCIKSCSLF